MINTHTSEIVELELLAQEEERMLWTARWSAMYMLHCDQDDDGNHRHTMAVPTSEVIRSQWRWN